MRACSSMVMRPHSMFSTSIGLAFVTLMLGCATPSYIPPSLWSQVDQDLTFTQLQKSPASYAGRVVLLGGEIISTKQTAGSTWIEVLQLPLYASEAPWWDRTTSEGRFFALRKEVLDASTISPGTLVSIVGEVIDTETLPAGQADAEYPAIEIALLEVWPWRLTSDDWFSIYWYYYYYGSGPVFSSGSGSGL